MSSPVRMGIFTASEIFFNSSVSCQGIMSSSHERLYLVSALPSRMQLLTLNGPKWSAEIGMSMPTTSRTAETYSAIMAKPFSVISVAEYVSAVRDVVGMDIAHRGD